MGAQGGPLWRVITYHLPSPPLQPSSHHSSVNGKTTQQTQPATPHTPQNNPERADAGDSAFAPQPAASAASLTPAGLLPLSDVRASCAAAGPSTGTVYVQDASGRVVHHRMSFFGYLRQLLATHQQEVTESQASQLPFNFWGGLVGYLGYELKAECGGAHTHAATTPDAALFFADRLAAIDNHTGDVYLLALYDQRGENHIRLHPLQGADSAAAGSVAGNGHAPSHGAVESAETQPEVGGVVGLGGEAAAVAWLDSIEMAVRKAIVRTPPSLTTESAATTHTTQAAASQAGGRQAGNGHLGNGASAQGHADAAVPCTCGGACDEAKAGPGSRAETARACPQSTAGVHMVSEANARDGTLRLRHPKRAYLHNIQECLDALYAGDSYEVCLTTALLRRGAPEPHTLYQALRALNPAPYGAWLHFGHAEREPALAVLQEQLTKWPMHATPCFKHSGPVICCSSPERFLRGDRGGVLEARPIKGTAARHLTDPHKDKAAARALAGSEKDRAENLMIVDLLRNDLGRVCEVGSVHVPGLMEIESYATVHQMVSTVRGVRRHDTSLVDALQAAFPAGSMTGAPKVRTMEIIDRLEGAARGVYSGCVGFIGLNDCFDLNVVIRTAVIDSGARLSDVTGKARDRAADAATASYQGHPATASSNGTKRISHAPAAPHNEHGKANGVSLQDASGLVHAQAAASQQGEGSQAPATASAQGAGKAFVWDAALLSIGAGGAIVVQSDLEGEFDEMCLKARALRAALGRCDGTGEPAPLDTEQAWV